MGFFKRKKTAVLTRTEALNCLPVKSAEITETKVDPGVVLITYPVRMRPWMENMVRRMGGGAQKPVEKKLQLDELGTAVWELLDGRRSVRQVIKEFAEVYQLHPKEAEVAVTSFLQQLGKRGLVGLK